LTGLLDSLAQWSYGCNRIDGSHWCHWINRSNRMTGFTGSNRCYRVNGINRTYRIYRSYWIDLVLQGLLGLPD